MPQSKNKLELELVLSSALQKATDYVVTKIWNENREIVRTVVYEAYTPEEYERTGEFREAWNYTHSSHNLPKSGAVARSEFYYNPSSMSIGSVDPNSSRYAQHIGVAGKYYGDDSRSYLADIIYNGIANGSYFGHGGFSKKRDAWKELNKRIGKRKMKQWIKDGMEHAGLSVQAHNVPLIVTTTKED